MARIVLAQDLAARLPGTTVLMPGDPLPPGKTISLKVTMQNFMPDADGTVHVTADWSILVADSAHILAHGRFARRINGGQTPAAEAQSMSRALGALADDIAASLALRP